jgi:nucleotide-binding universal stress UspA family protein
MFTSILVPLDGSLLSESALPAAGRIARASGGRLILATVISVPILSSYGGYDPLSSEQVDIEWRDAETYLERVKLLPVLADVDTSSTVDMGYPEMALLDAVSSNQCDLLVLTSHGRTGLARWALGSVTKQLVRHADVPVLVFREHGPNLESAHPDMEHLFRVLVCLDGSAFAEAALAPAAQLARVFSGGTASQPASTRQAGLHLVLVIPPSEEEDQSNSPPALGLAGAKEYLAEVADRMKEEYPALTWSWTVGVGADTAKTIVRVADSGEDVEGAGVFGGCDVVALSTHGRTGIARWTMGSVTERVLDSSKLPALVVRPMKPTDVSASL